MQEMYVTLVKLVRYNFLRLLLRIIQTEKKKQKKKREKEE